MGRAAPWWCRPAKRHEYMLVIGEALDDKPLGPHAPGARTLERSRCTSEEYVKIGSAPRRAGERPGMRVTVDSFCNGGAMCKECSRRPVLRRAACRAGWLRRANPCGDRPGWWTLFPKKEHGKAAGANSSRLMAKATSLGM
jgi:hypothetical protein